MPLTETDVGITEFLNEHEPFRAILKQQLDDFIVNEITTDGTVVYQRSLRAPAIPAIKDVNKEGSEKTADEELSGSVNTSPSSIPAKRVLDASVGPESSEKTSTKPDKTIDQHIFDALDALYPELSPKPSVALMSALERSTRELTFPVAVDLDSLENLRTWVNDNLPMYEAETGQPIGDSPVQTLRIRRRLSTSNPPKEGELNANEPDFDALDSMFPNSSSKLSKSLKEALDSKATEFLFPALSDKAARTKLHKWVRENVPDFDSDTVRSPELEALQVVRIRKRSTIRSWKRRRRDADERPRVKRSKNDSLWVSRDEYVQCTLWKRGRDTIEALSALSAILRVPNHVLSHAGTKDKRGVTVQHIRFRGVPVRRLASANHARQMFHHRRRCLALGDFTILRGAEARPLSLGDLSGNRFTLVLRDVDADANVVAASIKNLRDCGFINYFGMQRFGSGVSPTHRTGIAVLCGDFREACTRILTPLTVSSTETGTAPVELRPERKAMETALAEFSRDECTAQELLNRLPQWMNIERTIAKVFADDEKNNRPRDYKSAFGKLPRNLKRIYGHAVQSYLWNCMASKRLSMFKYGESGRRFAIADDIVPVQENVTNFTFSTKVRKVTVEEEKSCSISIENVLIPVVGSKVAPPDTSVGRVAQAILDQEGLDLSKMPVEYETKGLYRRLICKPEDLEYHFKLYDSRSRSPLVMSIADEVDRVDRRDHGQQSIIGYKEKAPDLCDAAEIGPHAENNNGESCTGRSHLAAEHRSDNNEHINPVSKISSEDHAHSIGSVSPIIAQSNDNTYQAEMKENDKTEAKKSVGLCSEMQEKAIETPVGQEAQGASTAQLSSPPEKLDDQKCQEGEKLKAVIVSFSLGIASYATMLVRELTQSGTSTSYQKRIQDNSGRSREKVEAVTPP